MVSEGTCTACGKLKELTVVRDVIFELECTNCYELDRLVLTGKIKAHRENGTSGRYYEAKLKRSDLLFSNPRNIPSLVMSRYYNIPYDQLYKKRSSMAGRFRYEVDGEVVAVASAFATYIRSLNRGKESWNYRFPCAPRFMDLTDVFYLFLVDGSYRLFTVLEFDKHTMSRGLGFAYGKHDTGLRVSKDKFNKLSKIYKECVRLYARGG